MGGWVGGWVLHSVFLPSLIVIRGLPQANNNPDLEELEKQRLAKMVRAHKRLLVFLFSAHLHHTVRLFLNWGSGSDCWHLVASSVAGFEAQALCRGSVRGRGQASRTCPKHTCSKPLPRWSCLVGQQRAHSFPMSRLCLRRLFFSGSRLSKWSVTANAWLRVSCE